MDDQNLGFLDAWRPEIVMFCGKGGVGKTTAASASAVHFALSGLRTLLISTDPAPSLSDILELDVSGVVTPVEAVENLFAVELDYEAIVALWKERFGDEVYDVASSFLPVKEEIIDYVAGAPGIDKEFALSYILDLHLSGKYDVIVWDTEPAGGTFALLKLQDTFYRHLGEAARLYVRVRRALEALKRGKAKKDPLKIIAKWEKLSKDVLDMMRDDGTQAFVVSIPEALCVNQTKRVVKDLEKFGIHVGGIVINRVITEEAADSAFNKSRREMQQKYIDELNKTYGDVMPTTQVPLMPFEIRGVEALLEIEKILFPI